ncbi:MAG: 30S ribosomal protein S12 methylthiotransferase RimO [Firmicutes bacterium]|nr:30S ribosomal protein S12 methylthiotransferase RimO [Bacillota bacterium]
MKKLAIVSLGCDKNRVDTEKMLGVLSSVNFVITTENEAQVIIINTCAFIDSAKKEAIDTILSMAEYKKSGACELLLVTGCLSQKYREELKEELKEVDAFLGTNDYTDILKIIENLYIKRGEVLQKINNDGNILLSNRILTTPSHYAYLKISDGCDNLCSYCTIPSIRGRYKSETIDDLVKETNYLVNLGVKEIILVAQDVSNYGIDIYGERRLVQLIKELSKTDVEWIRLMYCYIENIDDILIEEIKSNHKIVKYIDMPLQHISDKILKRMNRRGDSNLIKGMIDKLRSVVPNIALRTTFMVGFPDEQDDDFEKLANFLKDFKFNHAGFFEFSPQDGTLACNLPNQIKSAISKKRIKELALIQRDNVKEFNNDLIGKTIKVLYEGIDFDKNLFYGRGEFSAPDIDTLVYFKADFVLDVGNFYDVKIIKSRGYDLVGKAVDRG